MYLGDLEKYDLIIIWGCGAQFTGLYKKQFFVNYIVDNDRKKAGVKQKGIDVVSSYSFFSDAADKKVLAVISTEQYFNEIVEQIKESDIDCDVVTLRVMTSLYDCRSCSHALWGLDVLARDLLARCGYRISETSYIEVGANHPIYGNVTEIFYLDHARGFLIEANPDLSTVIEYYREGDTCINCGIAETNGSMPFYRFDNTYRNSFDKYETDKNILRGFQLKDMIDVEVITLDEMLSQYHVDTAKTFLSLQLMGMEKKVLKGFDHTKYQFPLISLAYYENDILEDKIFKDYREIARLPRHAILIREDLYGKVID